MDFVIMALIVAAVLAGISIVAYLRRIANATERSADALESLAAHDDARHESTID